jgi:hypothetical protein
MTPTTGDSEGDQDYDLMTPEQLEERFGSTVQERTITVGDSDAEHIVGNGSCSSGWCGNGLPEPCECGGLVHGSFGDENADGDYYWLWYKCDQCGSTDNPF